MIRPEQQIPRRAEALLVMTKSKETCGAVAELGRSKTARDPGRDRGR